jgi:hypothetical protein
VPNVLALLGVSVLLWLPRLHGPIDLRWDAGVYYVLGTSLAQGNGYRLLNEPGEIQAIQYPPLLPLFVAGQQLVAGTHDELHFASWLRASYFLLSALYSLAVYALARRILGPLPSFLATLLCVLSMYWVFLSDALFAELPFALAATLSLTFASGAGRRDAVLAGLFAMVAYGLRTAGVALLLAWVAESLLRRNLRQALARAALATVPVLCWQGYVHGVTAAHEYHRPAYAYQRAPYQFYNVTYAANLLLLEPSRPELGAASAADLAGRAMHNLLRVPARLSEAVSAPSGYWSWLVRGLEDAYGVYPPRRVILVPLVALNMLVLTGMILLLRRGHSLMPLYAGAYVALHCLAPWPKQFWRYVAPLTPVLAVCLLVALLAIMGFCEKKFGGSWRRAGLAIAATTLSIVFLVQAFTLADTFGRYHNPVPFFGAKGEIRSSRLFFYDETWRAYDASLWWLRAHTDGVGVIATSVPQWAYLRTGLKAVMPPMEADPEAAQRLLDSVPVRYLLVDTLDIESDMSRRYAAPVVDEHPELWRLVYAAPAGVSRLYERVARDREDP